MHLEVLRGNLTVKLSIDPVDVPVGIDIASRTWLIRKTDLWPIWGSLLLIWENGSLQCFRIFGRRRESS